ncbi:hypothetical protein [Burkholderia ambifaria]|uniref:hypothetical protein n=1 Tax=Burkholderia ambifaria TaxID=152480 RepID=UPI002FE1E5F3
MLTRIFGMAGGCGAFCKVVLRVGGVERKKIRSNEADQAESFCRVQRLPGLVRRLTSSHNAIGLHPQNAGRDYRGISRDYLIEIIVKTEFDILRASGLRFFLKLPTVG